ncbi:MAG: KUP/HAK/KT family potassium transporter [Opitutaceae bacterium]|nr:KUP/HAK/KT family potassium transporter [Opitutaceae bacterium]
MSHAHAATHPILSRRAKLGLSLGALGVVFGDIGTSPLYALRESLHYLPPEEQVQGVLGILSLIFWSLMVVVSLKYITVVMRADNQGEGGIFALLALGGLDQTPGLRRGIGLGVVVALVGAAMICGEGVITPAISVLSACEGLRLLVPGADAYVLPLCLVILVALFWFQRRGTQAIGRLFGPVMLVWFAVLGGLGLWHVLQTPEVLRALNPVHGWVVLRDHPASVVGILGSVVLAITGVEALYADMGHFGRQAILRAWYGLVLPGLTLNYFGQGAYALSHPDDLANPFLSLAPAGPLRAGLLVLSLLAAVIASQALISGTFSLIRQAIQLGYFPRLRILHTNPDQRGQIYLPLVNFALAAGSILTVLLFKSSSALAAAYGIAVTGTMAVTSFALLFVARRRWGWSRLAAGCMCAGFGAIDLIFFAANVHKFTDGGWLPISLAAGLLAIMHTWKSGRNEIQEKIYGGAVTELELSSIAKSKNIVRVSGSAVFMVATPKGTPLALLHHLKANKCLQQTVVLLTILTEEVPAVPADERMTLEHLGEGVWRAVGRYGYMETPEVARLVENIKRQGVPLNLAATTFYFNREMIITGGSARMFEWQKSLYAFLSRNASPIKDYYRIMPTQIIEIGLPVQL